MRTDEPVHGGMRLDRVDDFGNVIAGADVDPEAGIDVVCMQAPAIEIAIGMLLRDTKHLLDALSLMVHVPVERTRMDAPATQLTPDHADSTVRLVQAKVRECLGRVHGIPEDQTRLNAARSMVHSLHDALARVNVERDSTPGIRLIKTFIPCCHVVLSAQESPARKAEALRKWQEGRRRALGQVR